MSCQPGSPCYNSTTNTSGDPCNPNNSVSCETVVYNGPALPTTGIDTCTNLCEALQLIDNTISTIINNTANLITASNGLTKVSNDIRLGGNLTQTTLINTGVFDLILGGIDTGSSSDDLLVITSGGIVRRVSQTSLAPTIGITPNTGLKWTDSAQTQLQTIYNTLIPDAAVSVPVGGAVSHPASYWKTRTFVQVFDEILFPTQNPTYTVPTLVLSGLISQTAEVGSTVSVNLSATGSAWDGGAFTTISYTKVVNGGSPSTTSYTSFTNGASVVFGTEFTFADPNSPNIPKTAASFIESLTVPAPASGSSSTVTYQSSGVYGSGLPKLTSLNAADTRPSIPPPYATPTISTGPIGGGTLTTPLITITGIYPIFFGAIDNGLAHAASDVANDIQTGNTATRTVNKSLVSGTGTITAAFGNKTQKWFWIAVPASYTAKTTYKTVWNNIFGPFGNATVSAWDILTASQNVTTALWSGIPYRIYMTNYPTDTSGDVQIY